MHVFLLIMSISGRPEHVAAVCKTYKQCSDLGAETQREDARQFHLQPHDILYRVVPAMIVTGAST